jgi:hypothetical protein
MRHREPYRHNNYQILFSRSLKFDSRRFFIAYGYSEIDQRLDITWSNRDRLFQFLNYPYVPLHNKESEIAVREPVIKRKTSYDTRSESGELHGKMPYQSRILVESLE